MTRTTARDAALHSALATSIACLAMLFAFSANAQNEMTKAFGVKGGANWTNLYVGDDVSDENARFGFHFGLFGRVAPTGGLGIQVEALYDQKGTTIKKSVNTIDYETTYHFDYLDLPVMIVIPLGEVAELHAGGYVGYMIVSEVSTSGDLGSDTSDPDDGQYNQFDYGLVGGLGINIGRAQIGARYNYGLSPVADDDIAKFTLGDSKNSMGQLYLALALGKQ